MGMAYVWRITVDEFAETEVGHLVYCYRRTVAWWLLANMGHGFVMRYKVQDNHMVVTALLFV